MPVENEFRFLLPRLPSQFADTTRQRISQHYILATFAKTIRLRQAGKKAKITLKGPRINGCNSEFEYDIPLEDMNAMVAEFCDMKLSIVKDRITWHAPDRHTWEIDIFYGAQTGLIIAEIELPTRQTPYQKPDWLGDAVEITTVSAFNNAALGKLSSNRLQQLITTTLKKRHL